MKRYIYKIILAIHKLRIKFAAGWRKTYLTYLTPPVDFGGENFKKWFQLEEFGNVLQKEHKDLLIFPFARQIYVLDYLLSSIFLGACNENYFRFLFYRHSWKARNKHITSRRLSFIVAQLNELEKRTYLNDKVKFANHWQAFFNRRFCNINDPLCTKEVFIETFQGCEKIIVKPLEGMRGQEIQVIDVNRSLSEIYDEIKADSSQRIVEEYIQQTGLIHTFNPSSMNTVRVITLRDRDRITILSSTLRVGGKNALIDNLHAGGVGYTVCTENGCIHTGISMTGKEYSRHPETGIEIEGCVIPGWEKVKQFCMDAHRVAPEGLDYIGWDVCICEDKLYMIEGNGCPGASPCVEKQDFWKIVCMYFENHPEISLKCKYTVRSRKIKEIVHEAAGRGKKFLHKMIRFGKAAVKTVGYRCLLKIHEFRIRTAKGWRKNYLAYISPPAKMNGKYYNSRFQFDRFWNVLEKYHGDRLWFPFARLYYTIDFFLSAFFLGISSEYYYQFLFYNHNWKYRNKHITTKRLEFIFVHLNKPEVRCYLNDKMMFAEHWHDFYNRAVCNIHDSAYTKEQFLDQFRNCKKIIVKPLAGKGGQGIRVIDVENNLGCIYDHLKENTEALIVEEYIRQTGLIHTFNASSLNTLRVITLRDEKKITIISAYLRVGREGEVVDNLHSGGVGYTVYPANGRIYCGISMNGTTFSVHPDTGIAIEGHTIPRWEEVKQFCKDAHSIAPEGLDYIGWDVCISEDKLYMIEGNAYPGASACVEDQNYWKIVCQYFDNHPEITFIPKK